jgi:hypothetical protein
VHRLKILKGVFKRFILAIGTGHGWVDRREYLLESRVQEINDVESGIGSESE